MHLLILSGVGGSNNWLPLVFPIFAIVAIWKAVEMSVQFVKTRREAKQLQLSHEMEMTDTSGEEHSINE